MFLKLMLSPDSVYRYVDSVSIIIQEHENFSNQYVKVEIDCFNSWWIAFLLVYPICGSYSKPNLLDLAQNDLLHLEVHSCLLKFIN